MELPPSSGDSTEPGRQGESHNFHFEISMPRDFALGEVPVFVSWGFENQPGHLCPRSFVAE
jgi:hypothetical protein